MGNEVATPNAGLPANLGNMATALQQAVHTSGASGGDLYVKMTKEGEWVYGAEETEIEEGAVIAINPMSFQHGWTAWGTKEHGTDGTNVGEVMGSAAEPIPDRNTLPDVKGEWTQQVGVQMRITNGEDEGVQLQWKTNSHGGRKAWAALLQQVIGQINKGTTDIVPLVTLDCDSYKHKTYGKTYTPEINVVGWSGMDGEAAPAAAPAIEEDVHAEPEAAAIDEPEAEEEEAPPRRRRRVATEN